MKNENNKISNPFLVEDDDIGLRTPIKKKLYTISEAAKLIDRNIGNFALSALLSHSNALNKGIYPTKEYKDYGYLVLIKTKEGNYEPRITEKGLIFFRNSWYDQRDNFEYLL